MTTTLAARTIDGLDVLIVKEENGIGFLSCGPGPFTRAAADECNAIAEVFAASLIAPAPPAPRPQVKPKGLLGWFRSLAPRTPAKNSENQSQQVRS